MKSSPEWSLSRQDVSLLSAAVLASLAIFLATSAFTFRAGFPLDDSWIHQTYARNLALRGEWSFLPGQVSAGSTSPLWTVLLAAGFLLRLSPYYWTYFLGAVTLLGAGLLVEITLRRSMTDYRPGLPWAGCLFILDWHMLWAAVSGMETLLHILLVLGVMCFLLSGSRYYTLAGFLVGISVWVRPDGVTLLGPLALAILLAEKTLVARLNGLLSLLVGFGVMVLPYILFNLMISGAPFPNTFYAKQAEYAGWQDLSIVTRLGYFGLQFFQGVSLALLPGFIRAMLLALRTRWWGLLLVAAWMVGYAALYLSRLPVYQHGRYLMPALAVFLLVGLAGTIDLLRLLRAPRLRLVELAARAFLAVILAISFVYGALAYAQDVAYIESQMVDTARWVAGNIPPAARIAAHDIGALGFFDRHQLVDLAGLITPEVVPIINNEERLAVYMQTRKVEYLLAFSGWKTALVGRGAPLFVANGQFAGKGDLGSMAVYPWSLP
ncbi:MAG TPA: hypothetical protein VGK00_02425 [Anaerolineales bacterium]